MYLMQVFIVKWLSENGNNFFSNQESVLATVNFSTFEVVRHGKSGIGLQFFLEVSGAYKDLLEINLIQVVH